MIAYKKKTQLSNGESLSKIYTPPKVCEWIYELVSKPLKDPVSILDPACGTGNLLNPWIRMDRACYGIDCDPDLAFPTLYTNFTFKRTEFENWEKDFSPQLVVCNPPWGDNWARKHYPEVFIQRIFSLFGAKIPLVFLCPMGFRLNQKMNSRRLEWMRNGPEICSIVSCPLDLYADTNFHSEILIYNVPKLKPHYFLPKL